MEPDNYNKVQSTTEADGNIISFNHNQSIGQI